jgi:hypothetical protein
LAEHNPRAARSKHKTKRQFKKIDAVKSCAAVVIALAVLAGGLLIIRLCGEQRLQSLLDMSFLKKIITDTNVVSKNHPAKMISDHAHSK